MPPGPDNGKEDEEDIDIVTPIDPKPPEEEEDEPPVAKGYDKNGVQLLYGNGEELYNPNKNDRDDGKRRDFKGLKNRIVKGWELTGYFMFVKDVVRDEVSGKFSELNHSGKNQVQCYDMGIKTIGGGTSRWRFENPHPEYTKTLDEGNVKALDLEAGIWRGYKFIKLVLDDGNVLLEQYQDQGDNQGEKPANKWVKLFSVIDKKYKRTGPIEAATIRIDDPKKEGQPNMREKNISLVGIK